LTTFSPVGFVVAAVTVGVGAAAGLALVPVVGSYLGVLLGGVVAGLATADRPLLEAGLAGILANLGVLVAGSLVGNGLVAALSALGSTAPTTLLAPVVLGFAVGAFGAHFGDDLRDGLTDPAATRPSGSTKPTTAPRSWSDEETSTRDVEEADVRGTADPSSEKQTADDLELERE